MKIFFPCFAAVWCVLSVPKAFAQPAFPSDPLKAEIVTEDFQRFWKAFDQREELGAEAFRIYIREGTPGLKGFIDYRIINADSLYQMVLRRESDYENSRDILNNLESYEKRIQAVYAAMKYWYPDAVFPPVYFVVGRFNSGGTVSRDGLILGAEMQSDLKGLPGLVAHELIHFQQKHTDDPTLLEQALHEGVADFIGELISGMLINNEAFEYGERHRDRVVREFILLKDGSDISNWLYGNITRKDNRPNDLGYWVGYRIARAYFEKQTDKHQAIRELLDSSYTEHIVREGAFLSTYQDEVMNYTPDQKQALLEWTPPIHDYRITVQAPPDTEKVFISGSADVLGNWQPGRVAMLSLGSGRFLWTGRLSEGTRFKFTRGSWSGEARVAGTSEYSNLSTGFSEEVTELKFEVVGWKDDGAQN